MRDARQFYEAEGLHVTHYRRYHGDLEGTPVEGDVAFYADCYRRFGGPVLDIGCGDGRVAFPLAVAGATVVGIDLSAPMLARAEERRRSAPEAVAARLRFARGDMTGFDLPERFALAVCPFRAFQHLLTPEAQMACLQAVYRHLAPDGRLVLDLFDPRLEWCVPGGPSPQVCKAVPLDDGCTLQVAVLSREVDPLLQVLTERWRFTVVDAEGRETRCEEETLRLRWTYRYELRHLLARCGFELEAEHGDFFGAPPTYAREQVVIARRM